MPPPSRPPTAVRRRSPAVSLQPRVTLWLESENASVLCRGMSDILRGVDQTGSIKQAAERVGRSYRFVWARIKESERAIGAALVETQVGGTRTQRSKLTPLAADLVRDFDELRAAVFHLVDDVFAAKLKKTLKGHRRRGR